MKAIMIILTILSAGCMGIKDEVTLSPKAQIMDNYLRLRSQTASYSGSVLAAQKDTIILSKGYGYANRKDQIQNTATTGYKIGSITKTFTAVAILQLQEQGKLSIEDTITKYIKAFPNDQPIQVQHLLNHSSGLPEQWQTETDKTTHYALDEIINKISQLDLSFPPGTSELYSNCGYALLAKIIEVASGLSYEQYCHDYIFKPAGMYHTAAIYYADKTYNKMAQGYVYGAGINGYNTNIPADYQNTANLVGQASAYSTTEDLYKYDRALKNNTLLNKNATDLMLASLPNSEYTLGSWLIVKTKSNGRLCYFSGVSNGFESVLYRYLDIDRTIVALNNHQNTNVFNVSRTLSAVLDNKKIHIPELKKELSYDIAAYTTISGTYVIPDEEDVSFEIIIDNNKLFIYSNEEPLEELFLFGPNKFFSKNYDLQLEFNQGDSCQYTYNGTSEYYRKQ